MSLENELVKQINNLQKQVDALIKPEVNRWLDWTPTITQSVAVTITINKARYTVIGNTVHILAELTVTSAGIAGNDIVIGGIPAAILPVAPIVAFLPSIGTGVIYDNGTAVYPGFLILRNASTWSIRDSNTRGIMGTNPNFALANTDGITFRGTYERA